MGTESRYHDRAASRRGRFSVKAGIGPWVLALWLAAGCGWFETRDPLPGEPIAPVPWESPIEPETVLANMDSAMTYLGRGVTNYVKCFGDTFHFYPYANDAAVLAQQGKPGAYDDWTLSVEAEVVDLILNSAQSVAVQFEGHDVIADNTEYKIWEEQYTLDVQFRSGAQGIYEGVARLEIRIDPSQADQWFITRWQDFLRPGQPDSVQTWGWLRGQERQI